MRLHIPGEIVGYYGREREQINEANSQFANPSPQELELMRAQVEAVKQSYADRKATRNMILAEMGFQVKEVDGKKTIVPLSKEERIALLSKADRSRGEAYSAYADRAKSALKGQTKLPSFLKQDIDYKAASEKAMLSDILGEDALNSTAGKQAIEALKRKESDIRQSLQEQDLATAPAMMQGVGGQISAGKSGRIGAYDRLPRMSENIISARGGILQNLQQTRLDELKRRLEELETKRQRITSLFTLGGTVGGAAMAAANSRRTQPNTTTGSSNYVPMSSNYGSFYDEGQLGRLYGGNY